MLEQWSEGSVDLKRKRLIKPGEIQLKRKRDCLLSLSCEDYASIFNPLLKIRPSALVDYLQLQRKIARMWQSELIMSWGWAELFHCVYVQVVLFLPPTFMHRIAASRVINLVCACSSNLSCGKNISNLFKWKLLPFWRKLPCVSD